MTRRKSGAPVDLGELPGDLADVRAALEAALEAGSEKRWAEVIHHCRSALAWAEKIGGPRRGREV